MFESLSIYCLYPKKKLNLVFKSVPAAATCLCCQPLCFSSNFPAFEFCQFVVFYQSTHALLHLQTGLNDYLRRASSVFKNEPARQNAPTRFQLISCNSEVISTELTTNCRVGFKMIQNSGPSYKQASSPHVITSIRCLIGF